MTNQQGDLKGVEEGVHNAWALKRILKEMSGVQSFASTSLITIFVPPKTQMSKLTKMLTEELGTADCIKQRVNRQLVVDALKSIKQKVHPANSLTPPILHLTPDYR